MAGCTKNGLCVDLVGFCTLVQNRHSTARAHDIVQKTTFREKCKRLDHGIAPLVPSVNSIRSCFSLYQSLRNTLRLRLIGDKSGTEENGSPKVDLLSTAPLLGWRQCQKSVDPTRNCLTINLDLYNNVIHIV